MVPEFLRWLEDRTFAGNADSLFHDPGILKIASEATVADVLYHEPDASHEAIVDRVVSGQNELAVFLYRLGRAIYETDATSRSLSIAHASMKSLCACEIYYSNSIGRGLSVIHGEGTVIGSRNRIGTGLRVHHGVTIGHRETGGVGSVIGDDVTLYAGAMVLGELTIGDGSVVGANAVCMTDLPPGSVARGPRSTRRTHRDPSGVPSRALARVRRAESAADSPQLAEGRELTGVHPLDAIAEGLLDDTDVADEAAESARL